MIITARLNPASARNLLLSALALLLFGCSREEGSLPARAEPPPDKGPAAAARPRKLTLHGHTRVDNYYWLGEKSPEDPEIQALLAAENAHTRQSLAHLAELRQRLHHELASRVSFRAESAPVSHGSYEYLQRFAGEGDRPVYLRRHLGTGEEQVLLDLNRLAGQHDYMRLANWTVSQDEQLLAYVVDRVGRGRGQLALRNLKGREAPRILAEEVAASLAFAGRVLFYVALEPGSQRPFQVMRLDPKGREAPRSVYLEEDPAASLTLKTTRSGDFIVIESRSATASESRLIDRRRPYLPPRLMQARRDGHEYSLQHADGRFFISSNWQAPGRRIMTSDRIAGQADWQELLSPGPGVQIDDFEVFNSHLVLNEREEGLTHIRILERRGKGTDRLAFEDPAYLVRLGTNSNIDSDRVRIIYSSLTTPRSVYEVSLAGGGRRLIHQNRLPGGYRRAAYKSERLLLPARDGREVPVSLVYRRSTDLHHAPLIIHAYGAYGFVSEPWFQASRLSLLDRGFIYAIAHVRGGGELGPDWHDAGRKDRKWNSFHDFIDVTRELTARGYGDAGRVFARGTSAGGMLMGVVANEAPELYLGILVHAPFTDVLTGMLDPKKPLVAGEFAEWGNPALATDYHYLLSWSPYDQVRAKAYPHLLVTAGLMDTRTGYYDPLKWVQKLRALKTDRNQLLLDMDLSSGHAGPSSREKRFQRQALAFAFMLDLAGSH